MSAGFEDGHENPETTGRQPLRSGFRHLTSETARLLRARRFDEIEIEHVAEEIEDMGKSERRGIAQQAERDHPPPAEMEMAGRQARLEIYGHYSAGGTSQTVEQSRA